MSTTAAVVEILAAGVIALAWIVSGILLLLFPDLRPNLAQLVDAVSRASALASLGVLALAYALGWLVNGLSHAMARCTYHIELRRDIFGPRCTADLLDQLKAAFITTPNLAHFQGLIAQDTAIHRITRATALNLFGAALVLRLGKSDPRILVASDVLMVIALLSWWLVLDRYRNHLRKLRHVALLIPQAKQLLPAMGRPQVRGLPLRLLRSLAELRQRSHQSVPEPPVESQTDA